MAQALSLGSEDMLEGMSDYDNAVKCAAALKVTLTAANALASSGDAEEMRALRAIEQTFRQRAMAAADAEGSTSAKALSAIERQAILGTTVEHGQFALACLKTFQSGAT